MNIILYIYDLNDARDNEDTGVPLFHAGFGLLRVYSASNT